MPKKNQPVLLIVEELIEDIQLNINEMRKYQHIYDNNNYKIIFIYIYSLYEGALWQLGKSICSAFPQKLKELNVTSELLSLSKDDFISEITDLKLKKISKASLFDFSNNIFKLCNLENIELDKTTFRNISKIRNVLIHNNTLKQYDEKNRSNIPYINTNDFTIISNYSNELINYLEKVKSNTKTEYENFTYLQLFKEAFDYTVGGCFGFDYLISLQTNSDGSLIARPKFENLPIAFKTLSSGEKTMLAFWIQQYGGQINDNNIKFNNLNSIVSLDNQKLNFFVRLFERFPYLMNGHDFNNPNCFKNRIQVDKIIRI